MVKRNKRNIRKRVMIISKKSDFNGRIGIVKGFRGDFEKGNPYVQVFMVCTQSIWPFVRSSLKYI